MECDREIGPASEPGVYLTQTHQRFFGLRRRGRSILDQLGVRSTAVLMDVFRFEGDLGM